jgi:hypothetical protein
MEQLLVLELEQELRLVT